MRLQRIVDFLKKKPSDQIRLPDELSDRRFIRELQQMMQEQQQLSDVFSQIENEQNIKGYRCRFECEAFSDMCDFYSRHLQEVQRFHAEIIGKTDHKKGFFRKVSEILQASRKDFYEGKRELRGQIKSYEKKYHELGEANLKISQKLRASEDKYEEKSKQLQSVYKKMKILTQQNTQLTQEELKRSRYQINEDRKAKITNADRQQLQNLLRQIALKKQESERLGNKLKQIEGKIIEKQDSRKKEESVLEKIKRDIEALNQQEREAKKLLINARQSLSEIHEELRIATENLQNVKKEAANQKKIIQEKLHMEQNQMKEIIKERQIKLMKSENELTECKQKLKMLQEETKDRQQKLEKLQRELQIEKMLIMERQDELAAREQKLKKMAQKLQESQNRWIKVQQRLKQLKHQFSDHKQLQESAKIALVKSSSLFVGDTIENSAERQYLIQQLQLFVSGRVITKTKLLYMFPRMAQINFHEQVDNHPHFVVVLRMKNGHVIAFFSVKGLAQDADYSKAEGFLMSVTNRRIFHIKLDSPAAKLMIYDPHFMVVGNSDMRVSLYGSSGQIFSTFGASRCFFDTDGEGSPQILLGSSQRNQFIESCEIFQIFLE